jgi:serine/threonine-protein kinase HipA
VLHERDEREALKRGRRYMSNITVVEARDELAALPADILTTRLNGFIGRALHRSL